MNHFNILHGEEPNEPPIEWNNQPPAAHFKSRTSPPNTSPVFSSIMGRLNHHAINNGDVEVHPSYFPVEFNSELVTDIETTPIKSIDDDEMDHLLEFFHSEHDKDIMDVDIDILQYLLVFAPPSKFYTVSTLLFHKYVGVNSSVTNFMSRFSMFVPTKDTVKLDNGNTGHAQVIRIFYVTFLTVPLCIQWYYLVIVQVSLPTPSCQVSSSFMCPFF